MSDTPMPDAPSSFVDRVIRNQQILREIGVADEYLNLLDRPLSDLTEGERDLLKSVRLDLWLHCGVEDIRIEIARFWLSNQNPVYISNPNNLSAPDWVKRNKTWYTLWWKNTPFTMPGEHCRSNNIARAQVADRWTRKVFQPGRIGRPSHVTCELLLRWSTQWNGRLRISRENLQGFFRLFRSLGGDQTKLKVKLLLKDDTVAAPDLKSKREFPTPLEGERHKILDIVDKYLKLYSKHLKGEEGYGYDRFMPARIAHQPLIWDSHKDNAGLSRMSNDCYKECGEMFKFYEARRRVKYEFLVAFGR